MISGIHHINFLVRDLDKAIHHYESILGLPTFKKDQLRQRGVKTARVKLGETWLILVQPLDSDGVPAKHLEKFGEGFFLLSLETDNLEQSIKDITENNGELSGPIRSGLDDWQVQDLNPKQFFGTQIQIVEDRGKSTE